MKKVWKGAAAVVAALSLGVTGFVGAGTAMAAPTRTGQITVNDGDTHTYAIYQLATGDVVSAENGLGGTLSNAVAGTNFNGNDIVAALEAIKNGSTDIQKANIAAGYLKADTVQAPVANITADNQTATGLTSGYYLIKDTTPNASLAYGETHNRYVLVLVGDKNNTIKVTSKRDSVTSEKKVKDGTKSWNDATDVNIGDTVEFRLMGTLPANYSEYSYFKYNFSDTLSKGLNFNGKVEVYVGEKGSQGAKDITSYFEVTPGAAVTTAPTGDTAIAINAKAGADNKYLKAIEGLTATSKIFVYYSATLNENAVIGEAGNPNTMHLEYTSHPSEDKMGKTTEDKVKVFTFELDIFKTFNGTTPGSNDLPKFTLYKKGADGAYTAYTSTKEPKAEKAVTPQQNGSSTSYVLDYKGLKAGEYKLVETHVPAGYNKADDVVFTINADEHSTEAVEPVLTKLEVLSFTGATVDKSSGIISGTIVNNKGSELPSTGGMGTVVLYTVGGLIVLIAGVGLAVALRRRQA
ncbi:isopeptide-forming domain-containing fimbrial protein [Bifidobacterium animalis]|uniref:Gram-positive pilin backbone subunit 2, Cna-B-like domain-containing protein n=1 Tax=Bifidobacterium animalis subsp. lactis TaxID=302911 RepID=A0A8B3RK58_BIFAN|nr:isopeptide-forming domain-containing fimbrial protein [Bifidobacterium animalis]RYM96721.1 Gram-positive pilin backbone subunit 2, Cna-B-like domain-containing protein [Bifidobacterium animalis subsp. lactis]